MLDRAQLPRSFSATYGDVPFDLVVTHASDEASLCLNISQTSGEQKLQFPGALKIDRHAGTFEVSDTLGEHLFSLRPLAMKLNALPAKLLGVVWRMVIGLLGAGPRTVAIGGGEVGFAWNIMMLTITIAIFAFVATIGLYVVAPLLIVAVLSFVADLAWFQPQETARYKAFAEAIAGQVRDLVEDTVVY